jgi:hypothetical protein
MYELMSGRIAYEGPDTKTTNGYVVQGNAPPPTRHDPSIPEPLAQVCMTALQPSDKARFKDASEAESALRGAWERCLTEGLVHPAVLAMDETPHDKAPARLHEPRNATPMPYRSPMSLGDSQEMTAVNDRPPAKPSFQIESTKGRPGDDDPTKLMVREDVAKGKVDSTQRGFGASAGKPPAADIVSGARVANESAPDTQPDSSTRPDGKARANASGGGRGLIIASVVLLMLSAAGVGLYFSGYLG